MLYTGEGNVRLSQHLKNVFEIYIDSLTAAKAEKNLEQFVYCWLRLDVTLNLYSSQIRVSGDKIGLEFRAVNILFCTLYW